MKRIEKIEVKKSSGIYYYTGIIEDLKDSDWIEIHTIKGEILKFRKDQIDGRQFERTMLDTGWNKLFEMKRDELNAPK